MSQRGIGGEANRVGGALPILLLFDVAGPSVHDIVTGDLVADGLVRSLVGGVGLVLAVPLTTFIAAALAARSPMTTSR